MENESCKWGDQQIMHDFLSGEKYLAAMINSFLAECATPEMRQTLCAILNDTHSAAQTLFEEMNSRGWYPVTKAEEQKITQTKQQYSAMASK
jgi:spore coat protein CotF